MSRVPRSSIRSQDAKSTSILPHGAFGSANSGTLEGHRLGASHARENAKIMEHLSKPESNGKLDEYSDVYRGQDYLEAASHGDIGPNDATLLFSMDGAQLHQDKKSDC